MNKKHTLLKIVSSNDTVKKRERHPHRHTGTRIHYTGTTGRDGCKTSIWREETMYLWHFRDPQLQSCNVWEPVSGRQKRCWPLYGWKQTRADSLDDRRRQAMTLRWRLAPSELSLKECTLQTASPSPLRRNLLRMAVRISYSVGFKEPAQP